MDFVLPSESLYMKKTLRALPCLFQEKGSGEFWSSSSPSQTRLTTSLCCGGVNVDLHCFRPQIYNQHSAIFTKSTISPQKWSNLPTIYDLSAILSPVYNQHLGQIENLQKKRYPHPPQSIWIHCLVYLADWKLCQQLKPYHTECARENGISLSQSLLIIQRVTFFKTLDSTWGLTFYTAASRSGRWGILFYTV